MAFSFTGYESLLLILTYLLVYNGTMVMFFYTLLQLPTMTKTLYNFTSVGPKSFHTKVLLVALFSMAGVPPFVGFFTKLFLFMLVFNSTFVLFYWIFFTLLFLGLYFYIQNVRFLNTSSESRTSVPVRLFPKMQSLYTVIAVTGVFAMVLGAYYLDEMLLYLYWLFV